MVTRVRIEVAGACIADCEESVSQVRTALGEELSSLDWMPGEEHYERDQAEPQGSRHAYKGRAVSHANVDAAAQPR